MSITTPDSLHNAAGNRTADSVADVSNGILGGIRRDQVLRRDYSGPHAL